MAEVEGRSGRIEPRKRHDNRGLVVILEDKRDGRVFVKCKLCATLDFNELFWNVNVMERIRRGYVVVSLSAFTK